MNQLTLRPAAAGGGHARTLPGHPAPRADPSAPGEVLDDIYRRGDRWMAIFIAFHAVVALALAPAYDTWRTTAAVTVLAAGAFALSMWLRPGALVTRILAGVALQAFCALHIFQMRGLAEMHFFFFTATTALVIYQDRRAIWPGVLAIIAQHTVFSYWHDAGTHLGGHPFFEPERVGVAKLGFHFGIALAQAAVASHWAEVLRQRTLHSAAVHADLSERRQEAEVANHLLQEQAAEMEATAGELQETAVRLEEQTEAAQEAHQRVEAVLASISDAFFAVDREGRFTYANHRAEQVLGRRRADLLGRGIREELAPALGATLHRECRRALEAGAPATFEEYDPTLETWFAVRVYPGAEGLAVYFQDVTEQRRAAEALAESEARFRTVQEASPDGFQLCEAVRDGRGRVVDFLYRYLNPAGLRLVGRAEGDMVGRTMLGVFPGLAGGDLMADYVRVAETGEPLQREVLYHQDGVEGGFRVTGVRVGDGIALTFSDVTARLRAEASTRESESRFRAVFERAAVGMGRVGFEDSRWLDVNDAFCAMLGYSREALLATPWTEITHPEDADLDRVPFRRMAAGEIDAYTVEKRFIHRAGHPVWARLTLSLVRDAAARPSYEIAIIEDITERHEAAVERERLLRAEQAAREAAVAEREGLTRLVDALPVMVTVYDPALARTPTGAIRFNRAFVETLGWTEADARAGDLMALCYPDEAVRAAAASHMARPDPGWREIPTRARDGRTVPVLWGNVSLAGDRQVGVGIDRTTEHERELERERLLAAERTARERTERLQALTSALSGALTPADVVHVAMEQGLRALDADAGLVALLDPTGQTLGVAAARGYREEQIRSWPSAELGAEVPVAEAARANRPVVVRAREDRARRFPAIAAALEEFEATIALPLATHGAVIGVLSVNRRAAGDLSDAALAFMEAFARQCAQALERARLHEAEQRSRADAEAAAAGAERREAELSAVLERLPAAVWIADAAGHIERVSAATAQLYGGAPLLAATGEYRAYEAYWPAGHPRAGERLESGDWALARTLATGETVLSQPLEIARFGTGERRQVLNASAAVRDANGNVTGGVAVMFDVTEQEATRRALDAARAEAEAERRRLERVLDRLPVGVVVVDAAGRIIHHNPATEVVLGHPMRPAADLSGYAAFGAVHPDGRPYAPEDYPVARALLTREPVIRELTRYQRGDGRVVTLSISAAPVPGESGAPAYAVAVVEDVDEREAARAEAVEANRSKSQFLANMSHELRTPLNAIGGYVQLLEMELHGPVTPAQLDALGRIQRAQRHLLGLINDVLNFAKLQANSVEFDVRAVPLTEVMADVAPMVEPQLAAKGLVYRVAVPETGGVPLSVWADREKLVQILLNLISNAVKFTPAAQPDGQPGEVVVTVADQPGAPELAYLQVRDSGIGIPREKQDAIFDPFVQVQSGYTRTAEGTGLGLAISRDLARGMGGDLRVRSGEGRGSTFTVTLNRVATTACE